MLPDIIIIILTFIVLIIIIIIIYQSALGIFIIINKYCALGIFMKSKFSIIRKKKITESMHLSSS